MKKQYIEQVTKAYEGLGLDVIQVEAVEHRKRITETVVYYRQLSGTKNREMSDDWEQLKELARLWGNYIVPITDDYSGYSAVRLIRKDSIDTVKARFSVSIDRLRQSYWGIQKDKKIESFIEILQKSHDNLAVVQEDINRFEHIEPGETFRIRTFLSREWAEYKDALREMHRTIKDKELSEKVHEDIVDMLIDYTAEWTAINV